MNPVIVISALTKRFGQTHVLRGIDLSVASGEVLVVIGPSGSGKSTLLRCMNLLERPSTGTVTILGKELTAKGVDLPDLRRNVGMVFQSFNLFPHMTVLQNVMEGPRTVLKMSDNDARDRAMSLLQKVGVEAHADKKPNKISGGQQQRVAIARALAMEPQVMLFDEPTSSLDPELRAEVLDVMRNLASEGMTMVTVTHEMEFARGVADRIIFLDEGQIVEEGEPNATLTKPTTERLRSFIQTVRWGLQ
ncbi:MAG: amino acid ABC transporter ATP-binding protein [Acidimicrobiaceae bacterium]|nr:amino acid ABC transporter ATP-binding protein [Acidimicrobiaceae bacterium]